jgi:hypothetical protein
MNGRSWKVLDLIVNGTKSQGPLMLMEGIHTPVWAGSKNTIDIFCECAINGAMIWIRKEGCNGIAG